MPNEVIEGLALYCTDPKPGVDLWKRMKKHLILPERRVASIGILGGPISLAHPEDLPIEYALLMIRQIPFALSKWDTVKEILVVGHDCGYYEQIPHKKDIGIEEKQKDVAKAAKLLARYFPHLGITAFFAEDGDGFDEIAY